MKKFRHLIRSLVVNSVIFSLLQTTVVFSAKAQMNEDLKAGLGAYQLGLGMYSKFLDAETQRKMKLAQDVKNQQMLKTMGPSCVKPDNTSCYVVKSKLFPECPLPASMSNFPQNACPGNTLDPNQISKMMGIEEVAKNWVNHFDQMLNDATNLNVPFGLKCLQDKQKGIDSQLTEMVNNLTRLQDQLNKDKETFKANQKKLLETLAETNDELMGSSGSGKNNLNLKTRNFANYFSAKCQAILGDDVLKSGPELGLLGVMQTMNATSKGAAQYNTNKSSIESELRNDISKMQQAILDGGLEDFLQNKITETSQFETLKQAVAKQATDFQISKARISKELSKIGYELPTMDKNFSVDFDEFLKGSTTFFKKQYINDCVTGADKSGIAISTDQILNSLKQKSTGSSGTARDKYKAALKTILDSDSDIDSKLSQIKSLEQTYQDITITYQNSDAQRVTETPYDLYIKTLKQCEIKFDTSQETGANNVSYKKKIERGQALLREFKGLHDNYSSNLASRVLDKVLSCNGEAKKSGGNCVVGKSDQVFDQNSASFCMAHADQCANEISGCAQEASNHVSTRKTKMEAMAAVYNKKTEELVARSNQLFTQQKNAVMDMIKAVQAKFPGTNFQIPEGMFVTMPEMKKDQYGIDLAGDGNLAFMDELPKKIDLLKTVFKDQQKAVAKEIDDYIGKQTAAMEREKAKWQSLGSECKGFVDSSSKELAKRNEEGMKKQQELDEKVGRFCRKYSEMKENPLEACAETKSLAEDADKISAYVTNNALSLTGKFRNICQSFMNEKNEGSSDCHGWRDRITTIKGPERQKCEKEERDEARRQERADANSPSSRPVKLAQLCDSDDKTDDATLIQNIRKKLSDENDKELLSDIKDFKSLDEKKNKLTDEAQEFFSKFRGLADSKDGKAEEKLCNTIVQKKNKLSDDEDTDSTTLKKGKLISELQTLETTLAQKNKEDLPKLEKEHTKAKNNYLEKANDDNLKKAYEIAEKNLKDAKNEKEDIELKIRTTKSNIDLVDNLNFKKRLEAALKMITPVLPGKREIAETTLSRLGEQADGSCDARNISNIQKGFQVASPLGLDQSILGTNGTAK